MRAMYARRKRESRTLYRAMHIFFRFIVNTCVSFARSKPFYKINTSQWVSRRTPYGMPDTRPHATYSEHRDGDA